MRAIIDGNEGFVCDRCKLGLELLRNDLLAINGFTEDRRLGNATNLTLSMLTQHIVVRVKEAESKMQSSCLCKEQ